MKRFVHSFYNGKEQLVGVKIHSFSRNPFHSCLIIIAMLFVDWRFVNRIKQLSCHIRRYVLFKNSMNVCLNKWGSMSDDLMNIGHTGISSCWIKCFFHLTHVRTSSVCQSATVSIRFVWKGRKYRLLCAHQPHKIR